MKRLGIIGGEEIAIHFPERRNVDGPVPVPSLFIGSRRIPLDDNLPGRAHRLLPTPLAHASLEDWRPFICHVI